jgi:predicted transposase YbfD/YdcC
MRAEAHAPAGKPVASISALPAAPCALAPAPWRDRDFRPPSRPRYQPHGLARQRQVEGKTTTDRRYFIASLPARTAYRIAQVVRKHWRVENELHWSLDVCFGEDDSRVRIGFAAENLSRVRRIALMLLKQETTAKIGIKAKRLKAGWDEKYLLKVLQI